jgi:hypothetical protein
MLLYNLIRFDIALTKSMQFSRKPGILNRRRNEACCPEGAAVL